MSKRAREEKKERLRVDTSRLFTIFFDLRDTVPEAVLEQYPDGVDLDGLAKFREWVQQYFETEDDFVCAYDTPHDGAEVRVVVNRCAVCGTGECQSCNDKFKRVTNSDRDKGFIVCHVCEDLRKQCEVGNELKCTFCKSKYMGESYDVCLGCDGVACADCVELKLVRNGGGGVNGCRNCDGDEFELPAKFVAKPTAKKGKKE